MDEHWIEQIRNRFEKREIAPPEDLWNDICNIMAENTVNNTDANHDKGKDLRNVPLLRRTLSVAASVAIIIGVSLWFSKQSNHVYNSNEVQNLVSNNNADISKKIKDDFINSTGSVQWTNGFAKYIALKHYDINNGNNATAELTDNITKDTLVGSSYDKNDIIETEKAENRNVVSNKTAGNRSSRQGNWNLLLANNDNVKRSNRISVGVNLSGVAAVGNAVGPANSVGQLGIMSDPVNGNMPGVALLASVNDIRNEASLNVKTKHHNPVKAGISVGIGLTKRITMLSGVNYSYLSTEMTVGNIDAGFKKDQYLHYIGVPIAVSYRIWNNARLSVYATGGTEVAFCVSGKEETKQYSGSSVVSSSKDNVKDSKPQWSVNATAGLQYDISKHLGIFVEPGVGYYFDNGSSINNIYKDKPFNVNLNVGFRFNVNK